MLEKTRKYILIIAGLFLLFSTSEALYILNHKDVLSGDILQISKYLNDKNLIDLSFRTITYGKSGLPTTDTYRNDFKKYMTSIPHKTDLPKVTYDLALIALNDGHSELVPVLLKLSIERDLDFSFWYVELANYYVTQNSMGDAKSVIQRCVTRQYPKEHCENYLKSDLETGITHSIGFLANEIANIYDKKGQ